MVEAVNRGSWEAAAEDDGGGGGGAPELVLAVVAMLPLWDMERVRLKTRERPLQFVQVF